MQVYRTTTENEVGKEIEKEYIRYVLDQVAGQQTRAAAILGISRKALWEKRRRYGIR